jgi:hypothetical protein
MVTLLSFKQGQTKTQKTRSAVYLIHLLYLLYLMHLIRLLLERQHITNALSYGVANPGRLSAQPSRLTT